MLKFIVPGRAVPAVRTTNRQKFVCKNYARYRDYKDFFQMIAVNTQNKLPDGWYAEKDERVAIDVKVYLAGKRRVDADNLLKTMMDACNGYIWHDDSQVWDARVRKREADGVGRERAEIKIIKL